MVVALSLASACANIGGGEAPSAATGPDAGAADDRPGGGDDVGAPPDAGAPAAVDVEVPGTAVWTDTGVDLVLGEHVAVSATGLVAHGGGGEVGPDGDGALLNHGANIVNCTGHAGLLGRIGAAGEPFFLGSAATFAATASDRLFLGVNDVGVDNNAGGFTATVQPGLEYRTIRVSTLSVPGTATWTDSGIDLEAGDQVTITATGTVIHYVDGQDGCDPAGEPATSGHGANVLACPNHAGLIARVGDGPGFPVGRLLSIPVAAGGRLHLGVNDADTVNNAGSFTATVSVTRR